MIYREGQSSSLDIASNEYFHCQVLPGEGTADQLREADKMVQETVYRAAHHLLARLLRLPRYSKMITTTD